MKPLFNVTLKIWGMVQIYGRKLREKVITLEVLTEL